MARVGWACGKTGGIIDNVTHGIQRVADDNDDTIRRVFDDLLGDGFTLITPSDSDTASWERAAQARKVPLRILRIDEAPVRAVWGADHLLVRPDQHVCWRGARLDEDPAPILDRVSGRPSAS